MVILDEKIKAEQLLNIDGESFFEDMIKAVVDVDQGIIALNAELHSDLEAMLLDSGSKQQFLYGINILFDDWEIEFDSMINPPRNREAGYPRGGRYVSDPAMRKIIEGIVDKWIER